MLTFVTPFIFENSFSSAHAVAYAVKLAKKLGKGKTIVANLSGRGDKDVEHVRKLEGERETP